MMPAIQMNRIAAFDAPVQAVSVPSEPSYDVKTIRRAANGLSDMIREFGPESVVGTLLSQTLRELRSLEPSAASTTIIGPIRIAA